MIALTGMSRVGLHRVWLAPLRRAASPVNLRMYSVLVLVLMMMMSKPLIHSNNRQQQQTVYEKPIKPAVRKSNTYYYVQFGIYDSGKQLSDLLRQIDANRNGYPVTLFHSEKLGGYRSLLGPFQTKDQVIAATQYLKDLGLETWTFGRKSLLAK